MRDLDIKMQRLSKGGGMFIKGAHSGGGGGGTPAQRYAGCICLQSKTLLKLTGV